MVDRATAMKDRRRGSLPRAVVAALVIVTVGVLGQIAMPQTVGEAARRTFLSQLREHYAGLNVSIRTGHYDPDVGLVFEGLRINDPNASTSAEASMLRIDRLTVMGQLDTQRMIDGVSPLRTRQVVVDGMVASMSIDADGNPTLAQLWPLPALGPCTPRIEIRDCQLHLNSALAPTRPLALRIDSAVVLSEPRSDGSIDRDFQLSASADFVDRVTAKMVTRGDAIDVRCRVGGIRIDRDWLDRLPRTWTGSHLRGLHDVRCGGDITLAYFRSGEDDGAEFEIRASVHEGAIDHAVLPIPMTNLRGVIVADRRGFTVEAARGSIGDAIVRASGRIDGFEPATAGGSLRLVTRGLMVDHRLAASLPPELQKGYDRLHPNGRIDIEADLRYVDGELKTRADLTCHGVDVSYEKFPYPIVDLVGKIHLENDRWVANQVTGRLGGRRMRCSFDLPLRPHPSAAKTFAMVSDGPVRIDDALISAMSPRGGKTTGLETFVRSLTPRGGVHVASVLIATASDGTLTRRMDFRVSDGYLRYDQFPYPLSNVAGRIAVDGDQVRIENFQATNANGGSVRCDGWFRMPPKPNRSDSVFSSRPAGEDLRLRFDAESIAMDRSLHAALPASSRTAWEAIRPGGVLDRMSVDVRRSGIGQPLRMNLIAVQADTDQVTNRSLTLQPTSLPYRLDVTGGRVEFDGRRVIIESIRARHDASRLSADGLCRPDADGRWALAMNVHGGSRLQMDAELIAALPDQTREATRKLQLRGPISVRGHTKVTLPDAANPEPTIDWDLLLQLEGNRIGDVGPVRAIRGELSIKGKRDAERLVAEGEVRIDSMHVHDLQVTALTGPYSIYDDQLYLGSVSQANVGATGGSAGKASATSNRADSISGQIFAGQVDLDGKVVLSSGNFDVSMGLRDAQVPVLLAEFGHVDQGLTGTLTGSARLRGNLGTQDLLRGTGAASVTGANVYELPLIVQLLNQLRIEPTEAVAFTDGEMEFTLFGENVMFSELKLWGDLVALHGGGTLDRRRELHLSFNTQVSPQSTFSRLVRPFAGSRYTLWTINVDGPLNDLQYERRALDGVGETIGRWFPSMADTPSSELNR